MERVRARVKDKRVLALVKAFLKAGVLTELGEHRDTLTGTPQGGILSPLIFNIAMTALDEHLMAPWKPGGPMSTDGRRAARRRKGLPNWRFIRYADLCRARHKSANRRGYRRVVFLLPRHTTVHGSTSAMASRRTVSRDTPSRTANCPAVRKSTASPTAEGAGCAGAKAAATPRASASSSSGGNPATGSGTPTR